MRGHHYTSSSYPEYLTFYLTEKSQVLISVSHYFSIHKFNNNFRTQILLLLLYSSNKPVFQQTCLNRAEVSFSLAAACVRWETMAVRIVLRDMIRLHWAMPSVNSSDQQPRTNVTCVSWLKEENPSESYVQHWYYDTRITWNYWSIINSSHT